MAGVAMLLAGCEATGSRVESARQAIIAGTPDTGDPAIMALLSFKGNQGARCTASLISPRILLAGAHCIVETPGYERHIFPGNDDRNGAAPEMLAIKTVVSNPAYAGPRKGNDFCIIVLETPSTIPPLRLNRKALAGAQGRTVRVVGYGISVVGNLGTGGVKRQNTAPLAQVSDLLLTLAPNAHQSCEGDSGGPLLLDTGDGQGEVIIGVNSFVDAPACRNNSYFQRVDTQLAWIDEQIKQHDPEGMAPPADAGAADARGPTIPDAEVSVPTPTPTPPAPASDAQAPEPSVPPVPPPVRDAGRGPTSTAPDVGSQSMPAASSGDAAGGCVFAGSVPSGAPNGGQATAAVALMLGWAARRRRRARG